MSTAAATEPARERARGPVDPRLWRYSASVRGYLVSTTVFALVDVLAIVAIALSVGRVLAGVITTREVALSHWSGELTVLAIAIAVRVAASWLQTRYADRAAGRVVAELKGEVLAAATRMPPRELDARRDDIATVTTRGLDALAPYLTGYLPALVAACTLTPITWAVIAWQDMTSAIVVAITVPLIPVFMILIGMLTKGRSQRTLAAMTTLSSQLLDLLAGLPTLRALGRERGPEGRVRALGDEHRRTTMSALRVAFLSSMVLELLATLSVALVAVGIGLRLVFGNMELEPGIVALILAPEVYLPLRMVGQRFHAAEDGLAAAGRAFAVVDAAPPASAAGGIRTPPERPASIVVDGVSVAARRGDAPANFSATFEPGTLTVLTGPNGAGKSTLLQVVLGLTEPDSGSVSIGGVPVGVLDLDAWWSCVAWLPQHPVLVPGTVRANLDLAGPVHDTARVCRETGFDAVVDELPNGWDTMVGTGGVGLSLGQRQRLALTRTLASDRPVLLLDEPTAHLDAAAERTVLNSLQALAAEGRTVIVVGHRRSVLAVADRIVEVHAEVAHAHR
ncbi:thiol reductant ABC exporter subunit CydD [Rhodococcus sp. HNM0569]|uniref:thiol reductant ABC exporter subunit CydD n=1 Tax=Rhodococcus sp. HNM0569 TaxID=2716340 RepID=UPI00146D0350|nr:thiol reductant ABC exporter subunit CydD [Rhodococcus sp. HNM0569]